MFHLFFWEVLISWFLFTVSDQEPLSSETTKTLNKPFAQIKDFGYLRDKLNSLPTFV